MTTTTLVRRVTSGALRRLRAFCGMPEPAPPPPPPPPPPPVAPPNPLWGHANPFERQLPAAVQFSVQMVEVHAGFLPGKSAWLAEKTVAEIGPGQDLGVLLGLVGFGARGIAIDKYLCPWDPDYHPSFYQALRDALAERFPGIDVAPVEQVLSAGCHEADRLRVCRCGLEEVAELPDASIDMAYSNAVFEHFFDTQRACAELGRIARPGGWGFHQVDFRDHRDFTHPLEFLALPEAEFQQLLAEQSCSCGNRVRVPEMHAMLERAGFKVRFEADVDLNAAESYLDDVLPRALPRFRALPRESLRLLSGRFHLQKLGGSPETGTGSQVLGVDPRSTTRCRVPVPVSGQRLTSPQDEG